MLVLQTEAGGSWFGGGHPPFHSPSARASSCRGRQRAAHAPRQTSRRMRTGSVHTLSKDVPLHDPNGWVASGAVRPQIHKVPLEAGRPGVKDSSAFLEKFFGINGLQVFCVRGHQVLRVLSGRAAAE
jgi:hypothetical protein